jgi:hypothetical protein
MCGGGSWQLLSATNHLDRAAEGSTDTYAGCGAVVA